MSEGDMKYHVSDGAPLTPAQISRMDAIEAHAGDAIDIPETTQAGWLSPVRGKYAAKAITVPLDADILAWLRAKGPEVPAEINRILRERMHLES